MHIDTVKVLIFVCGVHYFRDQYETVKTISSKTNSTNVNLFENRKHKKEVNQVQNCNQ